MPLDDEQESPVPATSAVELTPEPTEAAESAFSIGWDPDDIEDPRRDDAEPPPPGEEGTVEAEDPDGTASDDTAGDDEPASDDDDEKRRRRKRKRRKKRRQAESEEDSDPPEETVLPARARHLGPAPSAATFVTPDPAEVSVSRSFGELAREVLLGLPDRGHAASDERKIAMFCDLENIAIGVRDSEVKKFEIELVLERLLEKGKIVVKRAYADWSRFSDYKRTFHESAIELIDIPQKYYSGKNSADIRMVVDAMDLCFSKEHLDTFVIVSGDSDFSPLVSKLKENDKYVIGVGVKNSSSNLLIDNCDEFIYYEDVWRDLQRTPRLDHLSAKEAEVFGLMIDAMLALVRENKNVLWASMVKQTMQRKRPSFSEGYYGYSTFSELLEDAARKSIIRLKKDQGSGNYIVTGFGQPKAK